LHDGAAIICNGRMTAAACFLPLTENPDLSKELGTRHRSAIGITEHSDAVSLVVSEETGTISLAEDGRIARGLSSTDLEKRLEEQIRVGNKRVGRTRNGRG
jgi:diadenylate cyclase